MPRKNDLRSIVTTVCRRARQQGYVVPQEVRDVLIGAGMPESRWKEVVSMAGYRLTPGDGRFYFSAIAMASRREQRRQRKLDLAVRQFIRAHKSIAREERRQRDRVDFVQPVLVERDDGRSVTLQSSDLSVNGIRLIGPEPLLGQKLRITLPTTAGAVHSCFTVRIMWSKLVREGLFENGGAFIGIVRDLPLAILSPFPGGYAPSGVM